MGIQASDLWCIPNAQEQHPGDLISAAMFTNVFELIMKFMRNIFEFFPAKIWLWRYLLILHQCEISHNLHSLSKEGNLTQCEQAYCLYYAQRNGSKNDIQSWRSQSGSSLVLTTGFYLHISVVIRFEFPTSRTGHHNSFAHNVRLSIWQRKNEDWLRNQD